MPEPLQQLHDGPPGRGEQRVVEAGDEERDAHRGGTLALNCPHELGERCEAPRLLLHERRRLGRADADDAQRRGGDDAVAGGAASASSSSAPRSSPSSSRIGASTAAGSGRSRSIRPATCLGQVRTQAYDGSDGAAR